jgi:hypothetical protein
MKQGLNYATTCSFYSTIDSETDDLLNDDTIRNASRTFRQTFDVPSTERLVNCKDP